MTTNKIPEATSQNEAGLRGYSPRLEPDPSSASSPAVTPDPSHGASSWATGPASLSPSAVEPIAPVPPGSGSSLTGAWPPGEADPRLEVGLKDLADVWALALSLTDGLEPLSRQESYLGTGYAFPTQSFPSQKEPKTIYGPAPGLPVTSVQNPASPVGLPESAAPSADALRNPSPYQAPSFGLYHLQEGNLASDLIGLELVGFPALAHFNPGKPNVGATNIPGAEAQPLPSWLTESSQLPPWAADWEPALAPALTSPKSGIVVTEPEILPASQSLATGTSAGPIPPGSLLIPSDFASLLSLPPPAYVGGISVEKIREDFPILGTKVEGGQPLIWLDNAATTQKPQSVIDRLARFYREENSNVHRGAHSLATKATEAYEEARRKVASFIGAPGPENIVFVRGTTEGINLVAQAFVGPRLQPGDEIVLTELEHHANIVPWQILAQQKGAIIKVLPIDDLGQLILSQLPALLTPRTRVISLAHVSNALGTVTELTEVISLAKSLRIPVVVDAAQSIAHVPIDVKALGADFLVFSGHKIYGPTGIGVVYGTFEALEEAQPWQGGGNMIVDVTFERTLYREPPVKFEAGTANIAGAVGLGAALDYVGALGLERIALYEEALLHYLTDRLKTIPGLKVIGTAPKKAGVVSFVLSDRAVADIGAHVARHGIALRAGHHCAQPAVRHFGLEGTVRPAPAFYNTPSEIDRLVDVLRLLN